MESLRSTVTRRTSVETCTPWVPNLVDSLDLEESLRQRQCNDEFVVHRIETAYAKIVDKVRGRKPQQTKPRDEEEAKSNANHNPMCLSTSLNVCSLI